MNNLFNALNLVLLFVVCSMVRWYTPRIPSNQIQYIFRVRTLQDSKVWIDYHLTPPQHSLTSDGRSAPFTIHAPLFGAPQSRSLIKVLWRIMGLYVYVPHRAQKRKGRKETFSVSCDDQPKPDPELVPIKHQTGDCPFISLLKLKQK